MPTAKKLIEVALPIKEISAESVRDKSVRHGHISTLHLWWARRPLPVCRAVVFASLVPDPLDPHCPPAFREGVAFLSHQVFLSCPTNALLSATLMSFDQALKAGHAKTSKFNALWIFSSLPQGRLVKRHKRRVEHGILG